MTCGTVGRDPRPLVAVDWSARGLHITFDGVAVRQLEALEDLLEHLGDTPHRIAVESTIESWNPPRRQWFAETARSKGHEVYVFRPIHTARERAKLGLIKSDAADACVIWRIGQEGRIHLYPLPTPDLEWSSRRVSANTEYIRARGEGSKKALADEAARCLGPYRDLDVRRQRLLGNGRTYYEALLAATYFAASKAKTRDEYERFLGLHGSAYPSILRSEVHHHAFRWLSKQGVEWTEFRRELRALYQVFKRNRPGPPPD